MKLALGELLPDSVDGLLGRQLLLFLLLLIVGGGGGGRLHSRAARILRLL